MLPHTLADPFLMVRDDALYIFLESQSPRHQGKIIGYIKKNYNINFISTEPTISETES